MEEVKRKEMQLYQLKKQIAENESKLKQQQTLYEAVCSDRNLCSKNLIEARDEITEMKRKLKIMSHQIDQLKEEIASKVCLSLLIYMYLCVFSSAKLDDNAFLLNILLLANNASK